MMFYLFISILTILLRLLPHPANFVPLGALAMFLFAMPKKGSVPLFFITLLVSDALIGFYDWRVMMSVYASFALMGWIGKAIISNFSMRRILAASMAGALSFFLITNFTVWFFGTMYVHDLSGLVESYAMAVPFFRNSLMADFLWSAIFFGAYERIRKRKTSPPIAASAPSMAVTN